jgi:hypothetical protein
MSNPYAIGRDRGAKSEFKRSIGGLMEVSSKILVVSPLP